MKIQRKIILTVLWFLFSGLHAEWAESTLKQLPLDEKIGQLIMAATYSSDAGNHFSDIEDLISKHHVGGLIFFRGDPVDETNSVEVDFTNCWRVLGQPGLQAELTNRYQGLSTLPLLIGQDCEWGLGMRLKNVIRFPNAMTLGAIQDDAMVYAVGKEIGQQCRAIGVHINFAPVVDVNTNPKNPIIGVRSFGDDKYRVTQKATAFARGLQDGGVLACAKHFPGHGDTIIDSHKDLPLIEHGLERLHDEELYPFKALIDAGVASIMTAHLEIPVLDDTPRLPSSLSKKIVTDLLQKDLGFSGLVVSDALVMQAITKQFQPGEAAVLAFLAGNDLLIFPPDVVLAIAGIKQAVLDGRISEEDIDQKVLKILRIKENLGLDKARSIDEEGLHARLHVQEAYDLKKMLYQSAVTFVRDQQDLLSSPINPEDCAYIQVAGRQKNSLPQNIGLAIELAPAFTQDDIDQVIMQISDFDIVLLTLYALDAKTGPYEAIKKIDPRGKALFEALRNANKKVIILACMNPYCIRLLEQAQTIIMAYEDDQEALNAALSVVFGTLKPEGCLPIQFNV